MSSKYYRNYVGNRDKAEPEIIDALEECGWEVHQTSPVDLVCLKWVTLKQLKRLLVQRSDGLYRAVVLMEAKTPYGKKTPRARRRKDQEVQNKFCDEWKIDKPTSKFEAKVMAGESIEFSP